MHCIYCILAYIGVYAAAASLGLMGTVTKKCVRFMMFFFSLKKNALTNGLSNLVCNVAALGVSTRFTQQNVFHNVSHTVKHRSNINSKYTYIFLNVSASKIHTLKKKSFLTLTRSKHRFGSASPLAVAVPGRPPVRRAKRPHRCGSAT